MTTMIAEVIDALPDAGAGEPALTAQLAELLDKIDKIEARLCREHVVIWSMFAPLLTLLVAIALKLFIH